MIDITITRAELLVELEAQNPATVTVTIPSKIPIPTDAHLIFRGHTVKEIFSLLKAELSERFKDVPRPQLIQDLLVPLKNALGNAYKRGNQRDRAKWISIEIDLSRKGALIAITDEGSGFDIESTLRAFREGCRAPLERGSGFRNLDRAHSLVSYGNGGRTLLLCFQPVYGSLAPGQLPDNPGRYPAVEKIFDREWMQRYLMTALQGFRDGNATLLACRPYAACGRANDSCGIRYVLEIRGADGRPEMLTLTGRLLADAAVAQADFEAASKLHDALPSTPLRIPRPMAHPADDPRLVLYDFDAWMNLWEYLEDRGSLKVVRDCAERVGQALALLHRSAVPIRTAEPRRLSDTFRLTCARVRSNLATLVHDKDFERRVNTIMESISERLPQFETPELACTHGAMGWDCVHYAVDRGFYLYQFENCRLSQPELDLGGFLADFFLFSAIQSDEEILRTGRAAFLASYDALTGKPANPEILRTCTAIAFLDRLNRVLRREQPAPRFDAGRVIVQCERVLKGVD
jgi:hypothetical protein